MWPWISGIMLLIPEASYLPSEALEKVETRKIRITSCPQATSSSHRFFTAERRSLLSTAPSHRTAFDVLPTQFAVSFQGDVNITSKEKNSKREKNKSLGLRCTLTGHERSKAGAYSSKTAASAQREVKSRGSGRVAAGRGTSSKSLPAEVSRPANQIRGKLRIEGKAPLITLRLD